MSNNHKINLATATIIGMNAMIGSGIFSAPAAMASNVGPAGIIAYLLVVCSIWFMAQSLARLAQIFPEEGSFYTYTKAWGGHIGGLIASGAYLAGLVIAMGLLTQMAGLYLEPFFTHYSAYTLGLVVLCSLVILNMFGVVFSQLGQRILIICTVFPLIATTFLCFTKANFAYLTPFAPYGITNILKATRIVIFGFFGFECAASLFNIVENPQKNIPKALTYSIILVGAIYTLFIASIIVSTPLHYFTGATVKISDILYVIFPEKRWLTKIIHVSILSAILGTVHSMIWTSGSLLLQLIKKLRVVRLPVTANIQSSVFAIGLCIFTSYVTLKNINLFFNLTAFFIVFAYIMSMITLLTIKKERTPRLVIRTLLGISTALVIFLFAAEGIVKEVF